MSSLRPLPGQEQSQIVWYERQRWDATMWSMVGRPERSDPDELTYNLFVSANAANGYDFVGYVNPAYDKLALEQRSELDQTKRHDADHPGAGAGQPRPAVWLPGPSDQPVRAQHRCVRRDDHREQAGIGIRNFWTFLSPHAEGQRRGHHRQFPRFHSGNLSPFNIAGATGWWIADLVWDRLMRIGPDGLPESVGGGESDAADRHHRRVHAARRHEVARRQAGDGRGRRSSASDARRTATRRRCTNRSSATSPTWKGPAATTLRITLKRPDAAFCPPRCRSSIWRRSTSGQPLIDGPEGQAAERWSGSWSPTRVGPGRGKLVRFQARPRRRCWRPIPIIGRSRRTARWIIVWMPECGGDAGRAEGGEINFLADYTGDPEL